MTYYKNEGEVESGIEYTIQQVRSPDSDIGQDDVSAWINGLAVYIDTVYDNPELVPKWLDLNDRKSVNETESLLVYLLDIEKMPCDNCERLRDIDEMVQTNFAGCECSSCAYDCIDSNGHDYECLNPNQKNNARVHTEFKCKKCDKKMFNEATA
jgi:hypothetical protein